MSEMKILALYLLFTLEEKYLLLLSYRSCMNNNVSVVIVKMGAPRRCLEY